MTAEELRAACEEDESFAVGGRVKLFWTNSGRHFSGTGTVARLNLKSLTAALDHPVGSPEEPFGYYPAGHKITVPRIVDPRRWTANNCARDLDRDPDHTP